MSINKIYFRFWNLLLIQAILMQQTHDAYECHAWFWVFKLKQQKVFDPSKFSKFENLGMLQRSTEGRFHLLCMYNLNRNHTYQKVWLISPSLRLTVNILCLTEYCQLSQANSLTWWVAKVCIAASCCIYQYTGTSKI